MIFELNVLQPQFFIVLEQHLKVLLIHVLFLLHLQLFALVAICYVVHECFYRLRLLLLLAFAHLLIQSAEFEAYLGQKRVALVLALLLLLLFHFEVDEVELFYLLLHGKHEGVHDLGKRGGFLLVSVVCLLVEAHFF